MEHYFIQFVEWVSENRFWIMPIILAGVLAMLVCAGSVLVRDIRDDLKEYRK